MDSKLLTALVAAFKRLGFNAAKGRDFVALVAWGASNVNAVRVSRTLEAVVHSGAFGEYTVSLEDISSDKRDAEFSVMVFETGDVVCGVSVSTMRTTDITTIVIYW